MCGNSRGASLLELLVVIAIVAIVMLAFLALRPGETADERPLLDEVAATLERMRPGDTTVWDPNTRTLRCVFPAGAVVFRLPEDRYVVTWENFTLGEYTLYCGGLPCSRVFCVRPRATGPVPGVCVTPLGGLVFRTAAGPPPVAGRQ